MGLHHSPAPVEPDCLLYAARSTGIATIFSCAAFSRSAFLLPPL